MSDIPQMMQACPKHDSDRHECGLGSLKCYHAKQHTENGSCGRMADGCHPACTPVPAAPEPDCNECNDSPGNCKDPATKQPNRRCPHRAAPEQPKRPTPQERIEREASNTGMFYIGSSNWCHAACRVIAAADAREDALRANVAQVNHLYIQALTRLGGMEDLRAELARLSGASGCCVECESKAREIERLNDTLGRIAREFTALHEDSERNDSAGEIYHLLRESGQLQK